MGKGPGLFSEIGKKARDVLYKDYNQDYKLTVTTYSPTGLAFSSNGVKKGEVVLGDITAQFKQEKVSAEVKVDTASNIFTTITWDELAPGLKTILKFGIPDQKSGKVEVQYQHDITGVSSSVGLTAMPAAEVSAVIGTKEFAVGGELVFDTAEGNLAKYNGGVSYTQPDFSASLLWVDKGDTLKFSYSHLLSPLTSATVAAEISHRISKNENSFTIGGLYMLDPLTYVKGRFDNRGKVSGLIQHEWRQKSLVTLSGEIDSLALDKGTKVGLSLVLKP